MSNGFRIFIVGGSLFTDTLSQMLATSEGIRIVGKAQDIAAATPLIATHQPDLVIVADASHSSHTSLGPLLSQHPDLPIICADLSHDYVQVITSQRIGTRREDLLQAIHALAKPSL